MQVRRLTEWSQSRTRVGVRVPLAAEPHGIVPCSERLGGPASAACAEQASWLPRVAEEPGAGRSRRQSRGCWGPARLPPPATASRSLGCLQGVALEPPRWGAKHVSISSHT